MLQRKMTCIDLNFNVAYRLTFFTGEAYVHWFYYFLSTHGHRPMETI
jgi:hypothetical protein